jgi:hypothetical protein
LKQASDKKSLYFKDPFMDLGFLHTLTLHGFKGSELGECYSAAAQIRDGDVESYKIAWNNLAEQVEKIARDAEAKGHRVSARQAYLRAVSYYRNVSIGLRPSDPAFQPTIRKYRTLFHKFAALSDPPIEVIEVPYEGKTLPGYFLRPDASGRKRPTIIVADNVGEELYYWGIPAIERGYNALFVDSPGIGLNPFNGIGFRTDTEVPINAAIDYLLSRSDVDTSRIVIYGGGENGGYIMTRAATHAKHIAACIVDPLISDMELIAPSFLRNVFHASESKDTLGSIYADLLALTCSITSDPSKSEDIKRMKADTSLITCPMLCLTDSTDYPEVHRQAREAVATTPNSTLRNFTSADRTEGYRELDNFSLKHRVMFDWLDDVVGLPDPVAAAPPTTVATRL